MAQSMYQYTPLPEKSTTEINAASTDLRKPIRLLHLFQADSFTDGLIGELIVYQLKVLEKPVDDAEKPEVSQSQSNEPRTQLATVILGPMESDHEYEALSYAWGSPDRDHPKDHHIKIYLNDTRALRTLVVTPNLESALRHLRYEDKTRCLWVDAICINQDDEVERSEQVPIMGQIYSRAKNVCVWLGEEDETSPLAFQHIERVLNLKTFDHTVRGEHAEAWAALAELMKREWFSRRWVVQEIAFAQKATVHCGTRQIDWTELADAVALFGSRADDIADLFQGQQKYNHRTDYLGDVEALGANRLITTISMLFRKADDGKRISKLLTLESLVSRLSAFKASVPHDIIYAVLSLASDTITSASPSAHGMWFTEANDESEQAQYDQSRADKEMGTLNGTDTLSPMTNRAGDRLHPLRRMSTTSPSGRDRVFIRSRRPSASGPTAHPVQDPEALAPFSPTSTHHSLGQSFGPPSPETEPAAASKLLQNHAGPEVIRTLQTRDEVAKDKARTFIDTLQFRVLAKTFHVDYKNKTFYEVCKEFIKFIIRSSESLDMLFRPWAPVKDDLQEKDAELPSWICRLDKSPFRPRPDGNFGRVNADLLVGLPESGNPTYSASAITKPTKAEFSDTGRSLYVDGMVLDDIGELRVPAIEGNVPNEWLELGGWHKTRDDPPESFWRTLVGDRDHKGHNPPWYYRRACQYAFSQRVMGGPLNTDRLMTSESSKIVTDYLKRVQAVIWNRRMIKTKVGERLGLVPDTAREGDKICILRGCSVPVVLRQIEFSASDSDQRSANRQENAENHDLQAPVSSTHEKAKVDEHMKYRIIGECYIHGVMDGEGFRIRDRQQLPSVKFELI